LKGIRWKLVSTYLLLIVLTLILIDSFIQASLINSALDQRKNHLLTQGSIIANRVGPNLYDIDKEHTRMYLQKTIVSLSLDLNARVMVVDASGKVLVDSFDEYMGRNIGNIKEVAAALHGSSQANWYEVQDVGKVIYVSVPIEDKGTLIGAIFQVSALDDLYGDVNKNIGKFLMLSMMAIVVTGVVSFFFADIIAAPVERLNEIVLGVTQGRTEMRAPEDGNDELSTLSISFNQMISRLAQIDEQRKQFVSNVSHELRTPLSSLKILSESLLMTPDAPKAVYQEFLTDINGEVDRLSNIISSLMYLTEMDSEGMKLNYGLIYINWLIRNVVASLRPLADQKHIRLTFPETAEIHLNIDKERIQQCLINIIGNAIKYTPADGYVTIRLEESREYAIIEVVDSGIGIPQGKLPLVFDRFYRVDEARARHTGGSGLGLSISQQIINLHSGYIEVESEVNVGTVFRVFLPRSIRHEGGDLS